MEPYRYLIEESVAETVIEIGSDAETDITPVAISKLKEKLAEPIYVPLTRQTVATKSLLHGVVLALRSYLIGDVRRFNIPVLGSKKGGRPVQAGFRMPGSMRGRK